MKSIPLVGYSDKISLRSEETISFKVSSNLKKPFKATLKRSISADPNPKGVGIIEEDASKFFKTTSLKVLYKGCPEFTLYSILLSRNFNSL